MASGDTFSPRERDELDRAVRVAGEFSGLSFSAYVGEPDGDFRSYAEHLHAALPNAARSVLVAVDPRGRQLEIVTGKEARRVLSDADCQLVILGMQSAFAGGDLVGGLVTGIQQLGEHARQPPTVHTDEP
ncbi:DUF5130 family protein [Actinopolymorpha alba]|uniref:DUF5130 family protein n=1 Tax=Actinopolymorpha alba TaxID=533267 RepID=UPI00037E067B|nr:DUF5130 family protein [Actinopolymorpha alba]